MEYQKQFDFLKHKFETGNLSHAYLFSGQEVESVKAFAREFVKFISKGVEGVAPAIEKEQFPDLLIIKSQNSKSSLKDKEDKQEIDVAQIRSAQDFLSYKPYYGSYKTVIIEHAERMNPEAQSCFLKTLEEPKGNTLILLISSKPDMLLNTIFSRCQQIKFFGGGKQETLPQEQKMLQDLLKVINLDLAEKFIYAKNINLDGGNFIAILGVLERYFRQLMLFKIGATEVGQHLPSALQNYPVSKIQKILKLIGSIQVKALTSNVNPKLSLEIILMEVHPIK